MSNYGRGPTGGGGVRPRETQRGGTGYAGNRDRTDDTVANHWPDYLKDGYFDTEGNLKVEYVSREKVDPLVKQMAGGRPNLTSAQLRRFFGHCRTLETRLKSGAATWDELRAQFKFLAAAAADAYGKAQPKIPGLFYDFIQRNVDAVKSEKDFRRGFLPHFEALVGFGSLHIQKDRN